MNRILPLLALVAAGSGCIYTNVQLPRAYRSAVPSEVKSAATDPTVTGQGCHQTWLYLVSWGDGGYAAAVRDALKGQPEKVLYDVKSDTKATAILFGLYSKVCTKVEGRVAQP